MPGAAGRETEETMRDPALTEPLLRGWIWNVYPRHSSDGVVAAGVEDDADTARVMTQDVLRHQRDTSAFGVVVDLVTGRRLLCQRAGEGFTWRARDD